MGTQADVKKKFLSASKYAVVGASKDQTKFGTKVRDFLLNKFELRYGPILTSIPTPRF